MQEFFTNIWNIIVGNHILGIIGALLILIIGWLLAVVVGKKFEMLIKKLGDNPKFKLLPTNKPEHTRKVAGVIGKISFYVILLFAVMLSLNVLNLLEGAAPIRSFIEDLMGYSSNLIGAGLLTFIAWLIACVMKWLSSSVLKKFKIDEKFGFESFEEGKRSQINNTASEVIFWVTFLFFVPAILGALRISVITEPLQQMMTRILEYVPNIIAAVVVLVLGLFIAKVVRKAVSGLLLMARLDQIGEKVGTRKVFGEKSLSNLVGIVAYALVALPVVVAALSALQIDSLTYSVSSFFQRILDATGNIIFAAFLVFIFFIVGGLVSGIVAQLLQGFGFDRMIFNLGFAGKDEAKVANRPSSAVGKLCFIAIMYLSAVIAAELLSFHRLAVLLEDFARFGGNVILAIIVMIIGVFLANVAANAIKDRGSYSNAIALFVRVVVLIFTGAIAIEQMDIGGSIVQTAFTLILGAICFAFILAFGLGGREFAAEKLQEWNRKLKEKK